MSTLTDLAKLGTSWLPGSGAIAAGIDAADSFLGSEPATSCPGQQQLAARLSSAMANAPADELYRLKSEVIRIFGDSTDRLADANTWAFHYLGGSDCRTSSTKGQRFQGLTDSFLAEWENPAAGGAGTADPSSSWQLTTTAPVASSSSYRTQMDGPDAEFLGAPWWVWATVLAVALGGWLIVTGRIG